MRASHVAKLFTLFPLVKSIHNQSVDDKDKQTKMDKLLSVSYSFTGGLKLADWLEMLPFSEPITKTALPESDGMNWESTVNGMNLYHYLSQLEDMWVGTGVRQQVVAFQEGFSDMADDNSGSLAFGAIELRYYHHFHIFYLS